VIFLCKSATKKILSVFFIYISTANEQREMKVEKKKKTEDLIKSLQITQENQFLCSHRRKDSKEEKREQGRDFTQNFAGFITPLLEARSTTKPPDTCIIN